MARIDDLLLRVADPQLRADLASAMAEVRRTNDFGLVYEAHLPETCWLPSHPVRRGVKVAERTGHDRSLHLVDSVRGPSATVIPLRDADGLAVATDARVPVDLPTDDLVVVAEFGDPIYPGLKRVGSIQRGGDKPAHVVINGENHHALEALQFTHAGKVDCIYIDPPYNTGAKDWKYNNDFVDSNDSYRHSKWLAMMERRLRLAEKLLNPERSVLIASIDEKEFLRLGLLLEQVLPAARVQMISTVINPKGAARSSAFARTDEYVFFVMFGDASPKPLSLNTEWKVVRDRRAEDLRWAELMRSGSHSRRSDRPNQFYPVFIRKTEAGPVFHSVGETYVGSERSEVEPPTGCVAAWPIRSDGSEGRWQVNGDKLRELIAKGYARIGVWREHRTAITYLARGEQAKVEAGLFPITARGADNSIRVDASGYSPVFIPGTQWRIESHNAEQGGTNLLKALMPDRKFPFPKSLYAVEDALRFFVTDKPNAVIVDFFAGSGTTAHAAMRLNRQDGGRRQSIVVTNNEVSPEEQVKLSAAGQRSGDPDWEALGIFEHITKPRLETAVSGITAEAEQIKGSYRFVDEFPMSEGFEENVEFFELTYQDASAVELDLAFGAIAPLLWMRAGGQGPVIECRPASGWAWADRYGVLWDVDRWRAFAAAAPGTATTAFIVTDSVTAFAAVASELESGIEPVRLYERYLTTFAINQAEPG